jgi:hypothetical protein
MGIRASRSITGNCSAAYGPCLAGKVISRPTSVGIPTSTGDAWNEDEQLDRLRRDVCPATPNKIRREQFECELEQAVREARQKQGGGK